MKDARIQFTPQALRVLQRLDRAPSELAPKLMRAMDEQNLYTVAHIQLRYLSKRGPDTLGVVTNRLRGSLWASPTRVVAGKLLASIGSNVAYAGVHEYGFVGTVQVAGYGRRNRALDVYREVRISAEFDPATGRITRRPAKRRTRVASGFSQVRAHSRHVHFTERAPIRRGIADRLAAYTVTLEQTAIGAVGGGS
jgi:phage gpG-like protein